MKKYIVLVYFFCCWMHTGAQDLPAPGSETYAVVIGISGYEDAAIPRLTYADKDAGIFAAWLQSKAGGSVPAYQVKLLTNQNATLSATYNAIHWLKDVARAGDIVYIYFSGHGDIETKDSISQGYLLAWNSPPNNYRNNAISVADLNETANTLTNTNNAKVILITDACHSGKMAGDFYKGRQLTAANLRRVLNNQARLASCRADEEAAEGPYWGGGRGVFSYYLLQGLNGKAAINRQVNLQPLQLFLDTAFATDKYLKLDNHTQHPVADGSPVFTLATIDSATSKILAAPGENNNPASSAIPSGLQSLKTIGRQPLDYFFSIAKSAALDSVLHFEKYTGINPDDVPLQLITDYISHLRALQFKSDSLHKADSLYEAFFKDKIRNTNPNDKAGVQQLNKLRDSISSITAAHQVLRSGYEDQLYQVDIDSLQMLQAQLQNNRFIRARFNDKFIQLTQEKTQDMINAYLKGDANELEQRQYYYAGKRNYRNFLAVMNLAIHLAPESNYLRKILQINKAYLAGVIDRLDISTHQKKSDSLLATALDKERRALMLEPYAAYIHNELGNILFQQQRYDSAKYFYHYASLLSPTWAIPWSNMIRLNLALNKLELAKEAIHIADSLQPGLAYINVNAGLVMEKDNNLLAAEGYYLNAIAQNKVHYLPYERLGKIYLQTGNYAMADSFLYEAGRRKNEFAVNEFVFDFGIELGGREDAKYSGRLRYDCDHGNDSILPQWNIFLQLENTLNSLLNPAAVGEDILNQATDLLQSDPALPLLNHYLGVQYYKEGKWQLAEQELKRAKERYLPDSALVVLLKKRFTAAVINDAEHNEYQPTLARQKLNEYVDASCMLLVLANYNYDETEDDYLLAKIYENKGLWDDAIQAYTTIAGIENLQQTAQAQLTGFVKELSSSHDFRGNEEDYQKLQVDHDWLVGKYNDPVRMGGTLKAAILYEALGKYEQAEETLLKQVVLNQQAGYARQAEMNKGNFGPTGTSVFNYYWLDVNRDLEAATYNFYSRRLEKFPRDAYWYKQAGMFLFNRLALTYKQVPLAERSVFHAYSLGYAYPFEASLENPNQFVDDSGRLVTRQNKFTLPATGEEIAIPMLTYDPVRTARDYLQMAIKFSGDAVPNPVIKEAIADLQSWMGNVTEAINDYRYLVHLQPGNGSLRNKLVAHLLMNKNFPAAREQLDSLHRRGQTSREQTWQLADFKIMSSHYEEATALLNSMKPQNAEEKNNRLALLAKQNMLQHKPEAALQILKQLKPPAPIGEFEYAPEKELQAHNYFLARYSIARLNAMAGKNAAAMAGLKELLDEGFSYKYVLSNDPAWGAARNSAQWRRLMASYNFEDLYKDAAYKSANNTETVLYRIPFLNKRWTW